MGVVRLWLCGRRQRVVSQGVGVRVSTLHGTWLVGGWFMVRIIVLVLLIVEAAIPFHGTASST